MFHDVTVLLGSTWLEFLVLSTLAAFTHTNLLWSITSSSNRLEGLPLLCISAAITRTAAAHRADSADELFCRQLEWLESC
jgi:hypothetical protein